MPSIELTLSDVDKLVRDKDIYEVYIDPYYFTKFKQLTSSLSYDERGEFFWVGVKKIRPLPFIKSGVISNVFDGQGGNEFKFYYLDKRVASL